MFIKLHDSETNKLIIISVSRIVSVYKGDNNETNIELVDSDFSFEVKESVEKIWDMIGNKEHAKPANS